MKNVLCCVACLILLVGSALAEGKYHREYAWIIAADKDTGIVEIQTISSKISITFQPTTPEDALWFSDRIGYIATATFACAEKEKEKKSCDNSKPYVFSADGKSVKMVGWRFLKKPREAWVAHGPGDKIGSYLEGLMIHGKIGNDDFFLVTRFVDPAKMGLVGAMKRDDKIELEFSESNPQIVRIGGVEMHITVFNFSDAGAIKP